MQAAVQISRIFQGILPDGDAAGLPAVFVLLAGCEISCDTNGAAPKQIEGERRSVSELVTEIGRFGLRHVYICGGEPLLDDHCLALADQLLRKDMAVLLETNSTVELEGLDPRIIKSIDYKCPSNGTCTQIDWGNVHALLATDFARFYISDRGDYVWARDVIRRENLASRLRLYLLPMPGELSVRTLKDWMLADRLDARLQVPLSL